MKLTCTICWTLSQMVVFAQSGVCYDDLHTIYESYAMSATETVCIVCVWQTIWLLCI